MYMSATIKSCVYLNFRKTSTEVAGGLAHIPQPLSALTATRLQQSCGHGARWHIE